MGGVSCKKFHRENFCPPPLSFRPQIFQPPFWHENYGSTPIENHKLNFSPGGHSNRKVTYKCLPENKVWSILCKFSLKKGVIRCGLPLYGMIFFWCGLPKMGVIKCAKMQYFQAKICKFYVKITAKISEFCKRHAKRTKNLKFVCKILCESGKKGVIGCELRKKGRSLSVRSASKRGVYRQALDFHRHMGVPPPPGFS